MAHEIHSCSARILSIANFPLSTVQIRSGQKMKTNRDSSTRLYASNADELLRMENQAELLKKFWAAMGIDSEVF